MIARRVMISGRVQGVGFRAWVANEAARNLLNGWVRNRMSGEVEAVFIGQSQSVMAMIEACRQGPRLARVTAIEVTEVEDHSSSFELRSTV